MKLRIDLSNMTFVVTKLPEAKMRDGKQQVNASGVPKWTTQLMVLDMTDESGGGSVIQVVTEGEKPSFTLTQSVAPVGLEAIPWMQNGKNGVAYRAQEIKAAKQAAPASASK